ALPIFRHGYGSRHAAGGASSGSRVDVFFVRVTRLTVVAVRVDKARNDGLALSVHHFFGRGFHARRVQTNDAAVLHTDGRVPTTFVVNDEPAGQQYIKLLLQLPQPPLRRKSGYVLPSCLVLIIGGQ